MHEIVIIQRMVKFARAKEHCGKKQRKAAIKSKKSLQKSFLRAKIQKTESGRNQHRNMFEEDKPKLRKGKKNHNARKITLQKKFVSVLSSIKNE